MSTLFIVGVGPGDPELMTLRAARLIAAAPVVAHFARHDRPGHARTIAAAHIASTARELRFDYPHTTDIPHDDPRYVADLHDFYDSCAAAITVELKAAHDVALLCEGDPFLYGSAMYVFDRLAGYPVQITPGILSMAGCWAAAGLPMAHGDDSLTVLPGTLDTPTLAARLAQAGAAVIMKLGRNLPRVRDAIAQAGLLDRAIMVERGTMADQRVTRLADHTGPVPYFAMVLIPGRRGTR